MRQECRDWSLEKESTREEPHRKKVKDSPVS